ncbi:MAG: hypothetical protein R6X35_02730 [Candidatus Krumholzibacteriia bacterium]
MTPTVGSDRPVEVHCLACGDELAELVAPRAAAALRHLELAGELSAVVVCCDDLPDGDDGWLRLDRTAAPQRLPVLTVFCGPRVFCDPGRGSVEPGPAVWEQRAAPRREDPFPLHRFSPDETNAFLHHQFALAADLMRGRILPDLVPTALAEAFAASWDVVLDGRLQRAGLPAYGQAVRRARFSRLFATAGVLMPGHWQIFQSLWDGGLAGAGEVLAAVRRLPRL